MSSGFSYTGGRPRCFDFWQEFQKCYASADRPIDCRSEVEDYNECLNHRKEIARAQAIESHFQTRQQTQLQQQQQTQKDHANSSTGIIGLNLIKPSD